MLDFSHREFLRAWFPSIARSKNADLFFHSYNEFLCTTPAGKRAVLDDKLLLSGALSVGGVRTPEILLTVTGGKLMSPSAGELSDEAAMRMLKGRDAFIKARTGNGGAGAFRLSADGSVHSADGRKLGRGLRGLLRKIKRSDYLVQELVRQDDRYAAIAPASVNTIRCITLRSRSGAVDIGCASWRMGNGKSVVDNASSGGMFCGVDPKTGRILGPALDFSGALHEVHPMSGYLFRGSEVPDIGDIFETAKAGHRVLDTAMAIGWDVAMTPDGPTIIEGNGQWGVIGYDLTDPDFERRLWEVFMGDRKVNGSGFPKEAKPARRGDMIRATLSIHGKVQGVGFRKWVSSYAAERGVQATPENLDDGTVRCRLIGQRRRIEFVTLACHRGPAAAEVEHIDVQEVKPVR